MSFIVQLPLTDVVTAMSMSSIPHLIMFRSKERVRSYVCHNTWHMMPKGELGRTNKYCDGSEGGGRTAPSGRPPHWYIVFFIRLTITTKTATLVCSETVKVIRQRTGLNPESRSNTIHRDGVNLNITRCSESVLTLSATQWFMAHILIQEEHRKITKLHYFVSKQLLSRISSQKIV
jgi:hypothetical protein